MSLAEELRKLQERFRENSELLMTYPSCSPLASSLAKQVVFELDPLITLAEAQEKELAALREHRVKHENDDGSLTDYAYLVKLESDVEALRNQHSADLREVAEMALRTDLMDYPFESQVTDIANEIIGEWCERKAASEQ